MTKLAEQLLVAGEVAAVMRRAFNALKNGRPGPALVEIPNDLIGAELDGPLEYEPVRRARSAADPGDVDAAARVLIEASNPIICAGQGVLYAEASAELVERWPTLLEAPVFTSFDGKSAFPEDHPLSLGTAGPAVSGPLRHHLLSADAVLGAGCSFTHHVMYPPMRRGAAIVHLTNDPGDLVKSYPSGVPPAWATPSSCSRS